MKYQKVKFSELKLMNQGLKLNDLNTKLLLKKYKVSFRDIYETIDKKIDIIDTNFKSNL